MDFMLCFIIDKLAKLTMCVCVCGVSGGLLILHVCALLECVVAAVVCVVTVAPFGSMSITSCPVKGLSDWYTMLYNPSPDYTSTLHCTQEAVYPL